MPDGSIMSFWNLIPLCDLVALHGVDLEMAVGVCHGEETTIEVELHVLLRVN